jgi:hypothetical protein
MSEFMIEASGLTVDEYLALFDNDSVLNNATPIDFEEVN